jgi:hypothetical protein
MTLGDVLIGICFAMPIGTAVGSAGVAKVGFGGYALAIAIGLAVGVGCAWTMWVVGNAVGTHLTRPDAKYSGSLQGRYFGALYVSWGLWIFVAGVLGGWASSAALRFAF